MKKMKVVLTISIDVEVDERITSDNFDMAMENCLSRDCGRRSFSYEMMEQGSNQVAKEIVNDAYAKNEATNAGCLLSPKVNWRVGCNMKVVPRR